MLGAFRACPAPRLRRGGRGATALPVIRGFALIPWEVRTAMERRPYLSVAQERDPPLVSGRWRVLGAALRRAIASRRAVPADVKDQTYLPPSSFLSRGICESIPQSPAGFKREMRFCDCARGTGVDGRPETGDPRHEETVRQRDRKRGETVRLGRPPPLPPMVSRSHVTPSRSRVSGLMSARPCPHRQRRVRARRSRRASA